MGKHTRDRLAGDRAASSSEDAFLGGRLRILQPTAGYRAGLDAVLLAAAAPLRTGGIENVLDVGAGVGVVGLAVARRAAEARVTMIEREVAAAELCRANIERNGLGERARVLAGDVSRPLGEQPALQRLAGTFEHVLANPPYQIEGAASLAPEPAKAVANAMPAEGLMHWLRFMAAMARPGGTATVIHRADRLGHVLSAFAGRFGGLVVFPLFPRQGAPAQRVLVQGIKGSRAPLQLRAGLILHDTGHGFRPEVDAILRAGHALDLGHSGLAKGACRSSDKADI
jgi:tRNA1(Val) A37 N6-methylase TrmN6